MDDTILVPKNIDDLSGSNLLLKNILKELVISNDLERERLKQEREDKLESIDKISGLPQKTLDDNKSTSDGLLSTLGGMTSKGASGIFGFVGNFFSLFTKLLAPVLTGAKVLLSKANIGKLLSRFMLPINAIFSAIEGVADFFDTSALAEKLEKDGADVTFIDRLLAGLAGFTSKFIGNLVDPILSFLGIDFSLEKFLDEGFGYIQKSISDAQENIKINGPLKAIGSLWDNLSKFIVHGVGLLLQPLLNLFGINKSAEDVINSGLSSISTYVKGIKEDIEKNGLSSAVSSIFNDMISGIKESIAFISSIVMGAIRDMKNSFITWVKESTWIPDIVKNALPDIEPVNNTQKNPSDTSNKSPHDSASSAPTPAPVGTPTPPVNIPSTEDLTKVNGPKQDSSKATSPVDGAPLVFPLDSSGTPIPSPVESNPPSPTLRKTGDMKTSEKGLAFIREKEAFRANAYQDQAGVWTIGYGTTRINGKPVQPGMTITKEQALQYKAHDIARFERAVNKLVKVPISQNEFDALVSFAYNVGEGKGGLATSTLLKKLNAGDRQGAAEEFKKWNKTGGQVSQGLVNRRKAEMELFTTKDEQQPSKIDISSVNNEQPNTPVAKLDVSSIRSTNGVTGMGDEITKGQKDLLNNTKNTPVIADNTNTNNGNQPSQININQTSKEAVSYNFPLRNDEPSFKNIIEKMAYSSFGVLQSPFSQV